MSGSRMNDFLSFTAVSPPPLQGGIPALASSLERWIEAAARNSYHFKTYLKLDGLKANSAKEVGNPMVVASPDQPRRSWKGQFYERFIQGLIIARVRGH